MRAQQSVRLGLGLALGLVIAWVLTPSLVRADVAIPVEKDSGASQAHGSADVALSATPLGDGAWALEARLRDASSGALGSHSVRFSATIEFLGVRPVLVGIAETDASGAARLTYRPTWNGVHRIVARAPFEDGVATSNETRLQVAGALPRMADPPARLPIVTAVAGPIAAVITLAVWGLLALVLIRVVVGIPRAAAVGAAVRGDALGGLPPGGK